MGAFFIWTVPCMLTDAYIVRHRPTNALLRLQAPTRKKSDGNERSKLRANIDNGLDCTRHNGQLHVKFMESLQGVLDSQLRQVLQPAQQSKANVSQPAQQSKSSKRRQRLRDQESRGEFCPTTKYSVCRSVAQSMGRIKYRRFLAQQRRLLEQINIVSAQQRLAT